jgi:hypothetical protein
MSMVISYPFCIDNFQICFCYFKVKELVFVTNYDYLLIFSTSKSNFNMWVYRDNNVRSIFRDKGDNECHDWYPNEIVLYFSMFVKETISVNFNEIRHFFHFLFIVDLLIEITHED